MIDMDIPASTDSGILKIQKGINRWLEQLGIIKKLQVSLVLSWILIILLGLQLLEKSPNHTKEKAPQPIQEKQINPEELKIFSQKYLEVFFAEPNTQNLAYLERHSEASLFIKQIYPSLKAREKQNIHSRLDIEQIYIEELANQKVKISCFAQENFPKADYENRELQIELIIDLEEGSPKVSSIPVFQSKNL